VTLYLLERAFGLRLLASMVACRGLIECAAFLLEFLPRATRALVVALMVLATLHVTDPDLFV
jgi:hypothetical protein